MLEKLEQISKNLRYWIIKSTTKAGSGHLTSSLSAVELMSVLFFSGILKYDISNPKDISNDKIIFSKGHAAPLLYSLFALAGGIKFNELLTLREFGSVLEGHPSVRLPFVDAATGSLGQGLSVGVGMALNAKYLDKLDYKTYVLLGDGETEEGQIWEACQIASTYNLNNLIAIVDINTFEQSTKTIHGGEILRYKEKFQAFGWDTYILDDGHDINKVLKTFNSIDFNINHPKVILASTIKGAGVSFIENKMEWHSKTLSEEDSIKAINELDIKDLNSVNTVFEIEKPDIIQTSQYVKKEASSFKLNTELFSLNLNEKLATKNVVGDILNKLGSDNEDLVVLDAGVDNSTSTQKFKEKYPDRFFQMYISEQNMVSTAVGLSKVGKIPFVSTFGAFFTRSFDQIRMASYSKANIKLIGAYSGTSLGKDGFSQMALEDISMMRSVRDSVILYPSDALSTLKALELALNFNGLVYIKTTREPTNNVNTDLTNINIGDHILLRDLENPKVTIISSGITLHESLIAHDKLLEQDINTQVIDLFTIKPLDSVKLLKSIKSTKILVVEDHHSEGGIFEAVTSSLINNNLSFYSLSVKKMPQSGEPSELLAYEEIDSNAIIRKVLEL